MTPIEPDPLALLADIELPPAPDATAPLLAALVLVAIVAATVAALHLVRRRRPARRASSGVRPTPAVEAAARLAGLEAAWRDGRITDREAAYRLCTLLRLGLGLQRLDAARPPAGIGAEGWSEHLRVLERLRYGSGGPKLDAAAFREAHAWLERRGTAGA